MQKTVADALLFYTPWSSKWNNI